MCAQIDQFDQKRGKTVAGVPNCHGCQAERRGNKAKQSKRIAHTGWNKRKKKLATTTPKKGLFVFK